MNRKKILIPIIIAAAVTVAAAIAISSVFIFRSAPSADTGESSAQEGDSSPGTTTLMIYMIGSDLESKAGAGSDDLDEILQSGVDLSLCRVVVYAGGTQSWYNEAVPEDGSGILELTENGFSAVKDGGDDSMGSPECLSSFLNYCCENYPADRFALILWDHGNGPVIGYGKDTRSQNDSLTLAEMREALDESPFGDGNKLEWVGFDACLMASAELTAVWGGHANYLVASQEVEPAFGWEYGFLSDIGKTDTETLLSGITERYLAACEEYYEEHGFSGRDTTLSCVDLSYAGELCERIDDLFGDAAEDVVSDYNSFAVMRVNSRAFGRASTGSEYDLTDLCDLADKFSEAYPEKAAALTETLEKMVIANANNSVDCCGLSLYYPFYNKYYYENAWSEEYYALNVLPGYCGFLKEFGAIWLSADEVGDYATSAEPVQTEKNTFTYQLTDEQAGKAAYAGYRILKKISDNKYSIVYLSGDVDYEDGLITANFDGNVVYVNNTLGDSRPIPYLIQTDSTKKSMSYWFPALAVTISDGEFPAYDWLNFALSVDRETHKISISSITEGDEDETENETPELRSGKAPDVDLQQFTYFQVPLGDHYYPERNDEGTILGIDDWPCEVSFLYNAFSIGEGVEFVYKPLDYGEYYIVFEITDTTGNSYCSELLPFEVENTEKDTEKDIKTVEWESGDSVLLTEEYGVSVSLVRAVDKDGKVRYTAKATNNGDKAVSVVVQSETVNGSVQAVSTVRLETAEPGKAVEGSVDDGKYLDFDQAIQTGQLRDIRSIDLFVSLDDPENIYTTRIAPYQYFTVNLSDAVSATVDKTYIRDYADFSADSYSYEDVDSPYLGATAKEQVVLDNDEVKVTLKAFGSVSEYRKGSSIYDPRAAMFCFLTAENKTDKSLYVDFNTFIINGVDVKVMGAGGMLLHWPVEPHTSRGVFVDLNGDAGDLDRAGIEKIGSLSIITETMPDAKSDRTFYAAAVSLDNGASAVGPEDVKGSVIYEKDGVKVTFEKYDETVYDWSDDINQDWQIVVENTSGTNIKIEAESTDEHKLVLMNGTVAAGSRRYTKISKYSLDEFADKRLSSVSFKLNVYSTSGRKLLSSSDPITLTADKKK